MSPVAERPLAVCGDERIPGMQGAISEPKSIGSISRGMRVAYLIVSGIVLVWFVVQFFLAGWAAFGGATDWETHAAIGHIGSPLLLIMVVLVFAGRFPRPMPRLTGLLVLVYIVQILLAGFGHDVPLLGALHPVNALAVVYTSATVVRRARQYVPAPLGVAPASAASPPVIAGDEVRLQH